MSGIVESVAHPKMGLSSYPKAGNVRMPNLVDLAKLKLKVERASGQVIQPYYKKLI